MKCLFTVLFFAVILAKSPAGVCLYCQKDGEVWLLLADHNNNRGWADFGGGGEEGETIQETAAREGSEETRGYFSEEYLLRKIQQTKVYRNAFYYYFFIEVPYVAADTINGYGVKGKAAVYQERGPYAWVPFSAVRAYLDLSYEELAETDMVVPQEYLPEGVLNHHFWSFWILNLKVAKERSGLPFLSIE